MYIEKLKMKGLMSHRVKKAERTDCVLKERERERDRKRIKFEQSLSDLCLLSIGKDVTARKFGLDRLESYT